MRPALPAPAAYLAAALCLGLAVAAGAAWERRMWSQRMAPFAAFERGDREAARTALLPLAGRGDARVDYTLGRILDPAASDTPDDGASAQQAKLNYLAAAQAGHVEAQLALAHLLASDRAGPADRSGALIWYRRAAANGQPEARLALATILEESGGAAGEATRGDAMQELVRAARQGHPPAQTRLALRYRAGDGVPQSHGDAVLWLTQAAEHGYPPAQRHLAQAYLKGEGAPHAPALAAAWALIAASCEGNLAPGQITEAMPALPGLAPESLTPEDQTREDLAQARRLASQWLPGITKRAASRSGGPDAPVCANAYPPT